MNTTTNEGNKLQVAETIIAQINAADWMARARWGVKMVLGDAGSAASTDGANDNNCPGVMLNCTRGIKIIVKLASDDTYSVTVGKMKSFDFIVKGELDGRLCRRACPGDRCAPLEEGGVGQERDRRRLTRCAWIGRLPVKNSCTPRDMV